MKQVLVVLVFVLAVLAAGLAAGLYAQQLRFEQLRDDFLLQQGEVRRSEEQAQEAREFAEAAWLHERQARLLLEMRYKELCAKHGEKE